MATSQASSGDIKTYNVTQPYINPQIILGESPIYDAPSNSIRLIAPANKKLLFFDVEKGESSLTALEHPSMVITVTAPIKGTDKYFMFLSPNGIGIIDTANSKPYIIKDVFTPEERAAGEADKFLTNDGAVDCKGRLFFGMMSSERINLDMQPIGTLRCYDPVKDTITTVLEGCKIPNGIAWSPDNKTMYFTDSLAKGISAFDYDPETGKVSNQRMFYSYNDTDFLCGDGHVVDVEGHLWSAVFGCNRVVRISPEGKIVAQIRLPTRCITCPGFGGRNFDELFITSAYEMGITPGDPTETDLANQACIFRQHVGVKGLPPNRLEFDVDAFLKKPGITAASL